MGLVLGWTGIGDGLGKGGGLGLLLYVISCEWFVLERRVPSEANNDQSMFSGTDGAQSDMSVKPNEETFVCSPTLSGVLHITEEDSLCYFVRIPQVLL